MSVYFYGCMTLDGYLADKDHNLNWLHQTGMIEETGFQEFYQCMDITIMGKRTFREIERMPDAAGCYPTTRNYVFTHQKDGPAVRGFTSVCCDVRDFVRRFGQEKNIWVVGGNTLLAPLLEEELMDELIIQIAPVLLGEGIPLFAQKEALRRFLLLDVQQYGQFAQLHYGREEPTARSRCDRLP